MAKAKIEVKKIKDFKTKSIYNVFVNDKDTKFKAKEIFKNKKIILYPFFANEEWVKAKYSNIKSIILESKDKIPKTGISLTDTKGYGFTKPKWVDKFFRFFENCLVIIEVTIWERKKTKLDDDKLYLSLKDFSYIEEKAWELTEAQKDEQEYVFNSCLSKLFPWKITAKEKKQYSRWDLERFFNKYSKWDLNFSNWDTKVIDKILNKSSLSTETLISSRNTINQIYIEDVTKKFKELLKQTTDTKTLEENRHQFFKTHTWIFSQIFAFPASFVKDKFSVAGQSLNEIDQTRIIDFIYKNNLTENIAFIEIKTHLKQLVNKTAYRKSFAHSISSDLSGWMIQVLDQRNQFLKDFYKHTKDTTMDSLNSICVLVIWMIKDIKGNKRKSFELFRSWNKDVLIITFDELIKKIEILLKMFSKTQSLEN